MTAAKVRADYEQLTQIAQTFGQRAETTRQIVSALKENLGTLQGGDWVGKGADAFYAEMASAVLPAMNRVVAAMNEAASTTTKVSRIMKQAEDEAAALFKLDGSQGAAGLGPVLNAAGAVGAVLGNMPAANGSGSGGTSGGGRSPSEIQGMSGFVNNRHDPAGLGGTVTKEASPELQEMLAELDPQVQEWIMASPALKMQLEKLAKDGKRFVVAKAVSDLNQIRISSTDSKDQFQEVVLAATLRVYAIPSLPQPTEDNHDEFVTAYDKMMETLMGTVMFNQIAVWEDNPEGMLHRPQDPSGHPMTPAEFAAGRRIYGQWVAGSISTDEAIRQMGAFRGQQPFPDTHPDHAKFKNHREQWVQEGWDLWDREMGLTD